MRIVKLFELFVTFTICQTQNLTKNIYLQDYGTYPVNWYDNFLIFFVTLKNDNNIPITAVVNVTECCELILNNYDKTCHHMRVDGSRTQLESNSITNSTLLYFNAYPYNRKGTCNVSIILYNKECMIMEFLQDIQFDTTLKEEDIFLLQESMLNIEDTFKLCEYPDENPLDLCAPVNCHIKYQGSRSIFDPIKRLCVPIPICNSKLKTNSSNIVYDPYINSCIEITDILSITVIDSILHESQDEKLRSKTKTTYHSNIRCHHGKMDEMNRMCFCNDGWNSILNWNFPVISTVPVHMCTINIRDKTLYKFLPMVKKLNSKNCVSFI